MEDFYTLITFAHRSALIALRTNSREFVREGLEALSYIDPERIDSRDATLAAALLSYAATRIGSDATGLLVAAASVSDREVAQHLSAFARKPVTNLRDWGFREVQTSSGAILTSDNGEEFAPAFDLVLVAQQICALIEADVWRVRYLTTGADLPSVWLSKEDQKTLDSALQSVVGCVSVNAALQPAVSPYASAQHLLAFVAEAATLQDARFLAQSAAPGAKGAFVAIGASVGTLCVVMIARSFVTGVESYERGKSLDRFAPKIFGILRKHFDDHSS
jgi:hypothetical protein